VFKEKTEFIWKSYILVYFFRQIVYLLVQIYLNTSI
jgi:hypothetical protein